MYYSITCSSIREIYVGDAPTTFSGSSSFAANDAQNITRRPAKTARSRAITLKGCAEIAAADAASLAPSAPSARTYKLNKPKIRRKINAFFNLRATREFCAFYTITFPAGISDDDAYRLFNIWQTRCRKAFGLSSFLWVAERQKNGTLHFHLLTNSRMPIKEVNGFMLP